MSENHETIKLERADEQDKPYLLDLRKRTMVEQLEQAGFDFSEDEHKAILQKGFEDIHLIKVDGKTAGMVKYHLEPQRLFISQFQIDPDAQGKGLGGKVLQFLLDLADTHQLPAFLNVLKKNPARKLYERMGFNYSGEDEHEYHMCRLPASTDKTA